MFLLDVTEIHKTVLAGRMGLLLFSTLLFCPTGVRNLLVSMNAYFRFSNHRMLSSTILL